jgi:hypothetical protein
MKRAFLKNISLIVALIVVVYLVGNNVGMVKSTIMQAMNIPGSSVQGISTQKAEVISEKIKSDLGKQAGVAQEYLLNLSLGDALEVVSRLQKIPKDFQSIKEYSQEQIDNMLKSKEK